MVDEPGFGEAVFVGEAEGGHGVRDGVPGVEFDAVVGERLDETGGFFSKAAVTVVDHERWGWFFVHGDMVAYLGGDVEERRGG